ncbi:putative non-ribosomal peptide synthetase [Gordonia polyisoprenivorans VH2]|uniref:Putative non-ribosomal peptide synthetase n=1 Tax=Gordonia polyisoprenivorans (strain DSM 44266 / VH2) TaxID=1112204 RepID=H6N1H5_GORPV|nr:non-ribosomal peptide synthetase [Gordonia polyisoprenivorans]AFA72186.1 putative non-ribosomal peptide synthetase [Gordonia polyisoprenivorans VH2]
MIRRFELNAAQRALWTTSQALPDLPLNIAQYVELRGHIDVEAFLRHTTEAVRNGQFMQVRYEQTPDGPVGIYDPSLHDNPEYLDLRGESDPIAAAHAFMRHDYSRPVDPATDRVMFGWLLHLADEHFYFYNRAHHLVVDGISGKDAIRSLLDAYTAGLAGEPIADRGPVDFGAPARADAEYRASTRYITDRDYWRDRLADMPIPASLAHRSGPPAPVSRAISAAIPDATMTALEHAATTHRSTVPAVIATALAAYLSRATGRDDVILNLPVAARTTAALRRTPLPVSNVVPLRTGVGATVTLADALRTTSAAMMGALRHQRYRYEDIRADLAADGATGGLGNPLGHRGLAGPMLNLMLFDREFRCGEATATFHVLSTSPVDDLSVNLYPRAGQDDGLILAIEANPHRYDDAEVAEHHRQILAMLAAFTDALTADEASIVGDLPLRVDPPAPPDHAPVRQRTLPEILASTVRAHPDAVAVEVISDTGHEVLTYRQLDAHAQTLANRLSVAGARPGRTVAIEMPRGRDQLLAWWAVAYTGATILLLDPGQPAARRARILQTAAPAAILTSLDDLPATLAPRSQPAVHLDDTAYLVFTSGTTGEPKPIAVTHRGLAALIEAQRPIFGDRPGSPPRIAALASPLFDAAHFEIVAAAATAGTLVPCRADSPLGAQFVAGAVTHVVATPSVLATVGSADLPRVIASVGEALPRAQADALALGHRLVNLYGPAEFTIWATHAELTDGAGPETIAPIGTPIDGTQAIVLDRRLRPVPPGVIGELYLAGPQVAQGYPGLPGQTAQRFVACPWRATQRMYRTGDLARTHPGSGALHFHGRADDQISVRGVRIEPAEIEHAATRFDGVAAAAAVPGEHGVDLAVVLDAGADRAHLPGDLRRHLAVELPPAMWPQRIAVLAALPVSSGGKLDRRAVAALVAAAEQDVVADVAPQGALEESVADAVAELLGIDRPSMASDLISLGATSLHAVTLRDRIGSGALGLGELLAARNLREVARLLADSAESATEPAPCPTAPGPMPATATQRAMVVGHRLMPESAVDTVHFSVTLPDTRALVARAVIGDLIARHEILRTVLHVDGAQIYATVRSADDAVAEIVDGGVELPDLIGSIPLRLSVDEVDGASVVSVVAHHVLVDDRSLEILLDDARTAWTARTTGAAPEWPSPATGYAAAAAADATRLGGVADPDSKAAAHLRFWRTTLADLPARDRLPADLPRADRVTGPAEARWCAVDLPDAESVTVKAAQRHVTVAEWLHAALVVTMRTLTGEDDTVVVIPALGRSTASAAAVGMFVNPIAIRVRAEPTASLDAVVAATAEAMRRGFDHAALPFGEVVRAGDPGRDLFGWPLSDVVVTHRESLPADGPTVTVAPATQALIPLKIDTELDRAHNRLHLRLTYRRDWFSPQRAQELLDAVAGVIRHMGGGGELPTLLDSLRTPVPVSQPPLEAVGSAPVDVGIRSTALVLAAIGDVLNHHVALDDRLLDLGATSLSVMQIGAALGERTGLAIEMRDVAAADTVADLCVLVERAIPADAAAYQAPAPTLTPQQEELWVLLQMQPDTTVYHLPVLLTLAPQVSAAEARAALVDVALRHPALRTIIEPGDGHGRPVPRVLPTDEAAALVLVETQPIGVLADAVRRPFDVSRELAWRAVIDDPHDATGVRVLLTGHHILVDAWSMRILVDEFASALDARASGTAEPFEPAPPAHRTPPDAEAVADAEKYWAGRLDGAPEHLCLPEPARPDISDVAPGAVRYLDRAVTAQTLENITRLAAHAGTTAHSVLRVALDATLAVYTGTDDVVIAAPIAGRESTADLTEVGMLVQTVLLRSTGVGRQPVRAALAGAAAELDDARAHAHLGYRGIADAAGVHGLGTSPAFLDVILAYGAGAPDPGDTALITGAEPIRVGTARTALEFTIDTVGVDAPELRITVTVAAHRTDAVAAALLVDTFVATIEALATATPDTLVEDCLPPVAGPHPAAERRTEPRDPIAAFAGHVVEQPAAVAVIDGDASVSYADLGRRVRDVAQRLTEVGVRAGDRVALMMGRHADTVAAILAVLEIDAVYVPIDPSYPAARIEMILADADPVAVIGDAGVIKQRENHRIDPAAGAGAAYIIYTSGSTGTPKGVQIGRAALAAMLGAALDAVGVRRGAVWSWTHSYAFDFSVWEILGALTSGGRIVVIDRDTVLDPRALIAALATHRVEILSQTPTSFARITDTELVGEDATLPALRRVVFGGEALDPPSLREWAAGHPGVRLVNMYGITETTVHLTHTEVDVDDRRSIIGSALDGVDLRVLDDRLRPVPVGGCGELYASGEQLGDGYLGATAVTATRFVADPGGRGTRLYRTGDLVRVLSDTQGDKHSGLRLAHLGRRDHQVQIRGHRVEPSEIAVVLRAQPGVTDARILVDTGAFRGDERIVAFVHTADPSITEPVLLAACAAVLPAHATPARIGTVTEWPMTDTGKLDRGALLAGLRTTAPPTTASPATRPFTDTEAVIARAVADVAGADPAALMPSSNFFTEGGTSLSAARLCALLTGQGMTVTVADVFAHPTIEALAGLTGPATGDEMPALTARDTAGPLPLSPEQEDLWLRWRATPDFTGQLLPIAVPVKAGRDRLIEALDVLLDRHDVLRTSFPIGADGTVYQQLWGTAAASEWLRTQLDGAGTDQALRAASSVAAAMTALTIPIDLTRDLPWRVSLVDDADGDTDRIWLVAVIHHIAVDGESLDILASDLQDLLAAEPGTEATAPALPVLPAVRYRDYSVWRQETLALRRDMLRAYWQSVFTEPIEPLDLPGMDLAAHAASAGTGTTRVVATLPPSTVRGLHRLAVDHHSTLYVVIHTALAAVLARSARCPVITTGAATSGRLDAQLRRVAGLFARTVPLRVEIDVEVPFADLLAQVTEVDLGAFGHADLPLAEIAEIADPRRTTIGRPLVDVALGLLDGPIGRGYLNSENVVPLHGLDVVGVREGDGLHLAVTCAAEVADAHRVGALLDGMVAVLEGAAADASTVIAAILSRTTRDQVPGAGPADRGTRWESLADLLAAGVRRAPDLCAVDDPETGQTLSFTALDQRSTALARHLISGGIGPGDTLVLQLSRSVWSVIAVHAVAKTGAAFVNVDPADPPYRRHQRIAHAGARTVLEAADLADLAAETADARPFDVNERLRPLLADDLAYLTFTSGTTGPPKAVAVTQRGLGDLARDAASRMALQPGESALHTYDLGFDAHLMGLLPVHYSAGTVVVCPQHIVGGDDLAALLVERRVAVLLTTPSVLATLRTDGAGALRHVVVGGEPLPAALVRRWDPYVTLTNEYGPTEATVAASATEVTTDGPVGIGSGLGATELHVLDDRLRPVPDWTVGELYLCGPALARGYNDESALTATSFVASPYGDGVRMYRTGDDVHRTADGMIVFGGRRDDQLKVRGIRVEAGEIDAALESFGEVDAAVSQVRLSSAGEKILVAWVVPAPGAVIDAAGLRDRLADVLPRTIIPSAIGAIDTLPIGRNGKLELSRLVTPLPGRGDADAPATSTEGRVAAVWAELLGVAADSVTTDSDFFALGGTSLSATRAQSRLAAEFEREVPLALLFSARTVGEVSRRLDALTPGRSVPAPRHRPRPEHLPLSYAQRRMWIHHRIEPESTAYHVPMILRIGPDVDLRRVRSAVEAVIAAHESLRTVFVVTPDGPEQRLAEAQPPVVTEAQPPVVTEAQPTVVTERRVGAAGLRHEITESLRAPFDLARQIPVRVEVVTVEDAAERYVVVTMHHIAVDGWSMRILVADLVRGLHGERLDEHRLTYADYTRWQHDVLGDPADPESRYSRDVAYWTEALDGVETPLRLPVRPASPGARGGRVRAHVPAAVAKSVGRVAADSSASVFHAVHTALALVLGRWTGRSDLVIGVPVHGRSAAEWESVVGMFVNTVAVRTHLDPDAGIAAALKHVREVAVTGAAHAELPYDAVVRAVRPDARGGGDPLISVLLVNQDVLPEAVGDFGSDTAISVASELMAETGAAIDAKFDVEVVLSGQGRSRGLDDGFDITVVHAARVSSAVAQALLDDVVETFAGLAASGSALPQPAARTFDGAFPDPAQPSVAVGGEDLGDDHPLVVRIASVMAAVLGVDGESVRPQDEFFALGGTSLSATQVASVLAEQLGRPVPTRLLFDHPSPAALASVLGDVTPPVADPWDPSADTDTTDLPLAPTQRRMWVSHRLADSESGGTGMYAVPVAVAVPAGTTTSRVLEVVGQIVERHPALRTVYRDGPDGPHQIVQPHAMPPVSWVRNVDLTAAVTHEIISSPFDLAADTPPVRVTLILDDAEPVGLVLVAHHITLDGESAGILHRDLTILLAGGDPGPAPVGFAAVAHRLLADESAQRQRQLDFWAHTLDGYPGRLDLATQRPVLRNLSTHTVVRTLDVGLSEAITEVAEAEFATPFHVLHTALVLALAVEAGTDDVAVTTPASLRRHPAMRATVGMLVSTVVLRTRLRASETLAELVVRVRDTDLAAVDNAMVGVDDLVALAEMPRDAGRHPLVQVSFSMVDAEMSAAGLVDPDIWRGTAPPVDAHTLSPDSEFDLQVVAVEGNGTWRLGLVYARDLFAEHEIGALADRLELAVRAVVQTPQLRVSAVPLLLVGERDYLDAAVDHRPARQPVTIAEFWTRTVARHPELIAVDDGDRVVRYRDLDSWISVTARRLRERGLGPGDAVALAIPRSIEAVVGFWAVTRIGATCVLVDVGYPEARIQRVIAAASARRIGLGDIPRQPEGPVEPEPVSAVSPDHLAYVITTSGTTGIPNAVGVTHRGVWRLAHTSQTPGSVLDRVAAISSPGFDATIFDLLMPVFVGGTHVVVPPELTGGAGLTAWLARLQVTTFFATPAVLDTLDPRALPVVREVYLGGETVPRDLADRWAQSATVTSVYGPTETTVYATARRHRIGEPVGIGFPLPGTGAVVLDAMLRPCAPGRIGELYLLGDGLARGYLGDPALTACRFVAGPGGQRLYRTGDLVRWDPRGTGLRYVSRADGQVKIRGQRVEPAEIDAVLRSAGAQQAATVLVSGHSGEVLVGYVVGAVDVARVLEHCRSVLPRHMVPSQIVVVDELPRTGSGKLDRARLPEPTWTHSSSVPVTPTEVAVVQAFSEILGARVGMEDDFFAAGGTSLALLRLCEAITERVGVRVSAAQVFAHPTPAGVVGGLGGSSPADDIVLEFPDAGTGPIVWCVHPASGVATDYRPLAQTWHDRRVLGLQLPGLIDAGPQPDSVPALVEEYLAAMRRRQPSGPYRLLGWSLGGVLAQEIARRLADDGDEVQMLVLLDSYIPDEMPADAGELDTAVASHLDPGVIARYQQRIEALVEAIRAHRPRPVSVSRAVYVAAAGSHGFRGWESLVAGMDVLDVGAPHAGFGQPDVMGAIGELVAEVVARSG